MRDSQEAVDQPSRVQPDLETPAPEPPSSSLPVLALSPRSLCQTRAETAAWVQRPLTEKTQSASVRPLQSEYSLWTRAGDFCALLVSPASSGDPLIWPCRCSWTRKRDACAPRGCFALRARCEWTAWPGLGCWQSYETTPHCSPESPCRDEGGPGARGGAPLRRLPARGRPKARVEPSGKLELIRR
ncbi:hypothetical protein MTO96_024478 [Rhipicephalus appendiculatus]